MKTSNILLIVFLIATFLLVGWFIIKAKNHINASYIETSGKMVAETVNVPAFKKVKVQGKFHVNLSQGDVQRVEITSDENIFSEVITEVEGDELVLRLRNMIRDQDKVTVNLQMQDINSVEFSAGTSLTTNGEISGEQLNLNSYAGSEGTLALKYNSVICESKAGSHISLSGTANTVRINSIAGSTVNAGDLIANSYSVKGSAGSHVEVHANNELTADISSGGSLKYSGDPTLTNFNTSSGGSINKR